MPDRANVKLLPPLIPAGALALGAIGHSILPVPLGDQAIVATIGTLLIIASVALVLSATRELVRARTAFDVRKTTTALVCTGAFARSRNPVYLSMLLLCWGIGLVSNSLLIALMAIPAGSILCLAVIRPEEAYLARKFGGEYEDYRIAVRRWF